ncbi:glycosyltransferase family 4 protein [Oecophyllibacter saccharovorans]|uniref:glycosyltransferase family 4 protein n=1 Tax=Oecophyllibacter saccharovorans TaxID=2558360 RepID=UPI0011703BAB|nr:glycosyltransferase family 1 protein [Oecophyllibacter saccharovorans]TPW36537.1 glycosyltransferase family 1 protein [Oecophyllibacter saccharovorans]
MNAPQEPVFILDLSRLMARAGQAVPTGIDRVELAYAVHLVRHYPERTRFAAYHPLAGCDLLPPSIAHDLIATLLEGWDRGERAAHQRAKKLADRLRAGLLRRGLGGGLFGRRLPGGGARARRLPAGSVYLLVSHHHLGARKPIRRALKRWGARFVPMVHDLIPLEFPEYARPREPRRHEARMKTVATLAEGVIVPCEAVAGQVRARLAAHRRAQVPVWVVPHGVHLRAHQPGGNRSPEPVSAGNIPASNVMGSYTDSGQRPYFVCLGTLEPRKNHLLLLNLWRRMAEEGGPKIPRLLLVGKRGWENENIIDMIERCPALQGHVEEHSDLSDEEVVTLLQGARGLLFPSFGEGYGLPLAEALSLGVPVICSDLPVFREVGQEVPCYLDPLDSLGWKAAIEDFSARGPLYRAQHERMGRWQSVSWPQSVALALEQVDG